MKKWWRVWCVMGLFGLPVAALAQPAAPALTAVATVAGDPDGKHKGAADGVGAAASFSWPMCLAVDAHGTVYVTDERSHTVRKITPTGQVTTLAGAAGQKGSLDGTGTGARFFHPVGVAVDSSGTLYVTDTENQTIRKITPTGQVSTLAGAAGQTGHADGNPAAARFNWPHGLAVDAHGTVYVADTYNHIIRKITPAGQVSTLAGAAGQKGSLDGIGAQARFFHPSGIAVDAAGTLYVTDNSNYTVRKISPAGVVSTLAGAARQRGKDDGPGPSARFHTPNGIAVDAHGTVYVAEYINSIIRRITPQGEVSTLAGTFRGWHSQDGPRAEASFNIPFGLAVGPTGWVYVADCASRTIRVIR